MSTPGFSLPEVNEFAMLAIVVLGATLGFVTAAVELFTIRKRLREDPYDSN